MKDAHRRLARKRYWEKYDKETYFCPDCGRAGHEIGEQFEVHHKDGDAHNNSMENLVGLCPLCHALRENRKPSMGEIKRLRQHVKPPRVPSAEPRDSPYPYGKTNALDYLIEVVKQERDSISTLKWYVRRSNTGIDIYQRIGSVNRAFSRKEALIRDGWDYDGSKWYDPDGYEYDERDDEIEPTQRTRQHYTNKTPACSHPGYKLKTKIKDNSPITVCENCGHELDDSEIPTAEKVKHFKLINNFKKINE